MILIYVTHPSSKHAISMIDVLIEEKLIACANVHPITSFYKWEGQVVEEKEIVSILKSFPDKREKLIARITELHSFEIPCILTWDASANIPYEKWLLDCMEYSDPDIEE